MSMLIFNNLVRKGDSILVLVDTEKSVGMEVIARSAFENYIDLINLFRHRPEYLEYLKYISSVQQERSIENLIRDRGSPLAAAGIRNLPAQHGITVEESLEMVKEETLEFKAGLSKLFTQGSKPISDARSRVNTSVKLRCELAGQLDQYKSLYQILSRSTHSDFKSMLDGVLMAGGYVWPPKPPPPSMFVVDAVTMMIHETTEILAKKLRKPFPAIKKLIKQREQLHSKRW